MARDNQNKISKKEQNKRSKKQDELNRRKKKNAESDSDSDNGSESEDEMDVHEYRKFISKIFPSKHMNKKVKAGDKLKKQIEEEDEDDEEEEEESSDDDEEYVPKKKSKSKSKSKSKKVVKRRSKKQEEEEWETDEDDEEDDEEEEETKKKSKKSKNKKSKKKIVESESEEESEDSDEEDDDDDDDDDDDSDDDDDEDDDSEEEESDDEEEVYGKKGSKLNIIFTIGGAEDEDDDDDDEDEDYFDDPYDENYVDSDGDTEDENESVSSDESEEDKKSKKKSKKCKGKKDKKSKKEKKDKSSENDEALDIINGEKSKLDDKNTDEEVLKNLKETYEKNKSKTIKKCIDICEENIKKYKAKKEKKEKKHKDKNLRIFRKIIKDKNTLNDFAFYEKLEIPEQKKLLNELREINKIIRIEKPYRMTLLESDIPTLFKGAAMKKINSLRYMEPGSGEFYKIKSWVDTFMRIPFSKYNTLPITIDDGVDKCHDFMAEAQKTLDDAVYGLNDAKMQIMQMLGQLITNPKAIGTAIAIHGPPGTGKTSLVKEGISKILNRPFAFIALGGATDSSFLEGHSYTYEGSTWGKILQTLIDSKCMNPVFFFDEVDKISDTPRGEEITGILTHLTDTTQNSQFHDKYFAEVNFDLSKCLFIFSYNDESKVNPILKDRMYRIQTKGYNQKQKTVIGNNYLLPKIREQVKFEQSDITIPDETIHYIIDNHCNKEDGVRNLKRCLEIIYTKLNLYRLMKPGSNLFEEDMSLKVEFPFTVTKQIVDKLIKKDTENISALYSLYV